MFKSLLVAWFLFIVILVAFSQEVLEDKNTGKLYYKTKNEAGEWVIKELPPRKEPAGALPGPTFRDADTQREQQPPSVGAPQSAKDAPIGYSPTGKPIYRGPRGGEYHYSGSGNKVYHPRGSSSSGRSSSGSGGRSGR